VSPRLRHWLKVSALAVLAAVAFLLLLDQTGLPARWMRRAVVRRIEKMTGGGVELGEFRFTLWHLRAELFNLTIHGSEPATAQPFFHSGYLRMDIRIVSLLGRKVALDELRLDHPALAVRILRDGMSNAPHPPQLPASSKPLRQELFDLAIGKLQILQGEVRWNDARTPLALDCADFRFLMRFDAPAAGLAVYRGELAAKKVRLQAGRSVPFASSLETRFSLGRDSFEFENFVWKPPHSELRGRAALSSFTSPAWTFSYQARLDFRDIRELLRAPAMPGGNATVSGEGRWSAAALSARGDYHAEQIDLPYDWFHANGLSSSGHYEIADNRVVVPDFQAVGLGGTLDGRLEMSLPGLRFRLESDLQGMSLAGIIKSLDHASFPVAALHWDSRVAIRSISTWDGNFRHLDVRGSTAWTPADSYPPPFIPTSAKAEVHFSRDQGAADLFSGLITTPDSRVAFSGRLGAADSALDLHLDAGEVGAFDDFINAIRGHDAVPQKITGRASWAGTITGPLTRCTMAGHFKATNADYAQLFWDELEGDVSYSPDRLDVRDTHARRARSFAQISLGLTLTDWAFLPDNPWQLDVRLVRTETEGVQSVLGTAYPVRGLLSGHFQGGGTHSEPDYTVVFELEKPEISGVPFDSARGDLRSTPEDVHIRNLEFRKGAGHAAGSLDYDRDTGWLSFDFRGGDIALEDFSVLSSGHIFSSGSVSFSAKGEGPLRAPRAQATIQLVGLHVGDEVLGDFDVRAQSDGQRLSLDASSVMTRAQLNGHAEILLTGNYPLKGDFQLRDMDLDVFLRTALRLKGVTGHSSATGRFLLSGDLFGSAGVALDAEISHIAFDYASVKLENLGPLRITYRREEVQVDQAHLRGPDTDILLSGHARFARDRQLAIKLAGQLDLRLLSGLLHDLEARGPAQLDVTLEGTTLRPRLAGRISLQADSATYGDFPVALSDVSGDLLFDINRLSFENVQAQMGGGKVLLSGGVSYGDGPMRYDLTARGRKIRVRYPAGMSWLADGNLRLQGTPYAAALSGRLNIQHLLLTEGLDLSSMIGGKTGASSPSPGTSEFLRNLQFDLEAASSPEAQLQWGAARFPSEAQLRLRGTADRPVLLGHIHLLSGEFDFRGNRFQLSRGEINFANPFRLDPVLDLEATTTAQQYNVTIHLSGPGSRLTLNYHSDPPLPSSDIITLLALGRTRESSDLRTGTSSALGDLGAQAVISEAISSQVGGRVEKLFGVSRFRVDPALSGLGATQNATARVTVQQRITHDLTVTYVTDVTSTQRQVIQFEYVLSRKFSVQALRDENGTFGVDLIIRRYFK
jgi:translocation and assembly module TamB